MKTIILLLIMTLVTACAAPPMKSFSKEHRYQIPVVEQPVKKENPVPPKEVFIFGDEVRAPGGCTDGVDC